MLFISFRNVDFQDTITLNPVDIVCALRPPLSKNITFTPDPSEWPTIAATSTPKAIWCDRWLQSHQATGRSTTKLGHPLVWSSHTCDCWYPDSYWSWTCQSSRWQIESSPESCTSTGKSVEGESIIVSDMENSWNRSSAKTSSSDPAKEGWKRPRKRWKILFTPWRRLETNRDTMDGKYRWLSDLTSA